MEFIPKNTRPVNIKRLMSAMYCINSLKKNHDYTNGCQKESFDEIQHQCKKKPLAEKGVFIT